MVKGVCLNSLRIATMEELFIPCQSSKNGQNPVPKVCVAGVSVDHYSRWMADNSDVFLLRMRNMNGDTGRRGEPDQAGCKSETSL